jgi:hypothetical protein
MNVWVVVERINEQESEFVVEDVISTWMIFYDLINTVL